MDDHKDILHAGLRPGLELADGASDAVDSPVVDRIMEGSEWNGRWFEPLLSGRIDFEVDVELGWWRTEIPAQLQSNQKRCPLSVERRLYPEHSAATAGHSFRRRCFDKHFADYQRCNKWICRSTQTSNRPVEPGSVVEAGFDPEKLKNNSRTAETAEFADQTAHTLFAQALIFLVEAPAVHSGRMDIVKSVTVSLRHLARLGLAAVLQMVD